MKNCSVEDRHHKPDETFPDMIKRLYTFNVKCPNENENIHVTRSVWTETNNTYSQNKNVVHIFDEKILQ